MEWQKSSFFINWTYCYIVDCFIRFYETSWSAAKNWICVQNKAYLFSQTTKVPGIFQCIEFLNCAALFQFSLMFSLLRITNKIYPMPTYSNLGVTSTLSHPNQHTQYKLKCKDYSKGNSNNIRIHTLKKRAYLRS